VVRWSAVGPARRGQCRVVGLPGAGDIWARSTRQTSFWRTTRWRCWSGWCWTSEFRKRGVGRDDRRPRSRSRV